jgi:para-nitrobenzyl esterase
VYEFAWPTPTFDGRLGACHAIDVPFTFNVLHKGGVELLLGDDAPAELALALHDAWWHAATTGDPNHPGLPHWPAYNTESRSVLCFDTPIGVDADPRGTTRAVWDVVDR